MNRAMRIPLKTPLFALLGAACVAAVAEWHALSRARDEKAALVVRLKEMEQTLEAQRTGDNTQGAPTPIQQDTELLRLRNEVTLLRGLKLEMERLRAENVQLRASVDSEKASAQAEWLSWLATARTNRVQPADVPYLLQALTNEQTAVRLQAAQVLRNIGLRRLLDTNLSSQAESELRAEARAAVPGLISALKDPDTLVRANVAITLGFLGESEQVVPALVVCLNDGEDRVATGAAKALGRLQSGAASAVPALLQTAQSPNQWRRETAINAIKQIDPEAARAAGLQ